MFLGPFEEGGDFRDEGISGPRRFLDKVWALVGDACRTHADDEVRHEVLVKYHQTVKRVTEGMEELRYNTSIAALMELVNALRAETLHAADAGGGAGRHAGAVRAALRRGELGAAGARDVGVRRAVAGVGRGAGGRGKVEMVVQVSGKTRVEGVRCRGMRSRRRWWRRRSGMRRCGGLRRGRRFGRWCTCRIGC